MNRGNLYKTQIFFMNAEMFDNTRDVAFTIQPGNTTPAQTVGK